MIVVDTNVWSEPMRPLPDPGVVRWMREHADELSMPAVVVHELRFGVALLPPGGRRDRLAALIDATVESLGSRVLVYDGAVASTHARLRAVARAAGREPTAQDGQIAAHALHRGAPLATRNTSDFDGLGLEVVDPWR